MGVYVQKLGDPRVAAVPEPLRFQTRIQTPLFFVQEAIEQNNRRFEFIGQPSDLAGAPLFLLLSPVQDLPFPDSRIGGKMHVKGVCFLSMKTSCTTKFQQCLLRIYMYDRFEFVRGETGLRTFDEFPRRLDQVAVAGEPNIMVRPQAMLIEPGDFLQGVILAAVGITGSVTQFPELTINRHRARGSEGALEFRQ